MSWLSFYFPFVCFILLPVSFFLANIFPFYYSHLSSYQCDTRAFRFLHRQKRGVTHLVGQNRCLASNRPSRGAKRGQATFIINHKTNYGQTRTQQGVRGLGGSPGPQERPLVVEQELTIKGTRPSAHPPPPGPQKTIINTVRVNTNKEKTKRTSNSNLTPVEIFQAFLISFGTNLSRLMHFTHKLLT